MVERGIAAKNGRIKTRGSVLAEDIVLSTDIFRDLDPAVALTFVVQVAGIEKKYLEELMKDFPRARKKIRIATFKLAPAVDRNPHPFVQGSFELWRELIVFI